MSAIFNGDYVPQRRGTNSVKWDTTGKKFGDPDLLPMWVADMDFPSPTCVIEALKKAVDFGVYAYYTPPVSYLQAFIRWEKLRHNASIQEEWLRFSPGVITGMYWCVQTLTQPNDSCIILTPCYYPFMGAILDNGRKLVTSDLQNNEGYYTIDFDDFEQKIEREHVKIFLLCSPHNPVGRVWTQEELTHLVEICIRHHVYIVSDEIHQDITFGCHNFSLIHIPACYNSLVLFTSASKTFNLAGCQNSFTVIPDPGLRAIYDAHTKRIRILKGVLFGYIATEAAFNEGIPWLEEVLPYIADNYQLLKRTLTEAFPKIYFSPLEGTYMCWIDLGAYVAPKDILRVVQENARLAVDYGAWFWPEGHQPDIHIRINVATSRANVQKASEQLKNAIRHYVNESRQLDFSSK
jgi:Bifunctional PLP-dependent enzyme with beta-cystathionase and maltose regulon repressor activities